MPNEKNKITEAAIYDKLFREISPVFLMVLVEKVLGLDIVEYTELKDKLQITRQKETDTLRKVRDSNGNVFILQIEIQTQNNPKMAVQMADYWILLHQIHELPIRQYVLYVGPDPLAMSDRLELPNFNFQYTLLSFSDLSYDLFIGAEQPEVKMLALLGDLKGTDPFGLTEDIVRTIDKLPEPVSIKENRLMQLRILIQLRKFTPRLEVAMLKAASFFKEEKDPFYKRGQVKGAEKERAKAYTEKLRSAQKMKQSGFEDAIIADVLELPLEVVRKLQ
ncbi:hypothetical protein [Parapedobacter indicus]|uniref:Transposase (putative) YhgA-like domain-containing protein n=1 Tax=Parapedobacter indicus TaxID=1477437 RepID=A0A1I3V8H9_9SPHI|nr:hypothetical protein [Parapedobacter indicus]PPK98961.1 hypothetical protein CLV26_11673 [Parapedobacter indicus]SFJ91718.1 hypothetical protein SAMN05444682_11611 [Parapedobacter indicus]